jgi:hypothetical protein
LHRALIYPLLYYVAVTLIWGRKGKRARIVDIDLDRFARRSDEKSIQKQLGEWGAQVHFLYCITWAVIFGLLAGPVLGDAEGPHARKLFILFACVAGVAAIVHHLRYMFHDREIALRERVNRNALPSTSAPGGLSSL